MRTKEEIVGDFSEQLFNDMCFLDLRMWAEKVFGYQVKDFHMEWLDSVHSNRFTVIKAFRGCFTPDTIVLDRKGYPCKISEHPDSFSKGVQPAYRVWFKNGMNVKCTMNHKFYTDKGFKQLNEIDLEKDSVSVLGNLNIKGGLHDPKYLRLLGYLNTGGYFNNAIIRKQSIKFTNTNENYVLDCVYLINQYFPEIKPKYYVKGNAIDVVLSVDRGSHNPLREIVKSLDYDHNFPRVVFKYDDESIISFINSVYACDGSIYNRKNSNYSEIQLSCGINEVYAKYFQLLLLRLGIRTILKHHKKKKAHTQYDLCINRREDIVKFFNKVGLIYGKEKQSLIALNNANTPKSKYNGYKLPEMFIPPFADAEQCYFTKIRKIEYLYDSEVFDMTVPSKKWYIADGAHVHNSGKSTMLGVIYPLWLCWYRPGTHILFTASETNQAIKILDEVKETIENNELLKPLMPPNPSTWKKTELKMTNGSRIFCRPYTMHIKGLHVNYVFADEVQDCVDRLVFYRAVAPTVNHKKGHLVATGTPNDISDLLEELSNKPEYHAINHPVLIKPGVSRWPEVFPISELEKIRKRDGEASYQTQYMMNPKAETEGAVYLPEWVDNCFDPHEKFITGVPPEGSGVFVIGGDFAISKGARADFDAYVVVEKISDKAIIRWGERHKGFSKDAKIQRLKELIARFKPVKIILDPSLIGDTIINELRMEGFPVEAGEFHARSRNSMLVNLLTMIQPDRSGTSALVIPRDKNDMLTMTFTNKLVEELISFKERKSTSTNMTSIVSTSSHDDTVMALALACKGAAQQKEFVDFFAM